jgi:beta-N-acetylhexosaminidase
MDEKIIGTKLLYAFEGKESLPEFMREAIQKGIAGVTLFRYLNVDSPAQVRRLCALMQNAAQDADQLPLLIAADQEGGQLMAINGTTPLPGNMALGATGSAELAYQAGKVLATELAAMGVNVNYAPSLDVNNNPANPVIGVRSFGADPQMVAKLGVAMIKGMQENGVVACAKHFPGHGDTDGDSHHMLPAVNHDRKRLDDVEFPPFLEAFRDKVQMVMTAHLALPAVEGNADVPATLSHKLLTEMLRETLQYEGVIITDAMEMKAIRQGYGLPVESMAAFRAGADILLMGPARNDLDAVFEATLLAAERGFLEPDALEKSAQRVWAMRKQIKDHFVQPELSVLQCDAHMKVAREIADKSITLLRDDANLLPLKLEAPRRIVVLLPKPVDLTPADTSSYVQLSLLERVQADHANVQEYQYTIQPDQSEIDYLLKHIKSDDVVLVGTINARQHEGQVNLVKQLVHHVGADQIISVAMRLPDDLAMFPQVKTALCSYSILEPSLQAVVDVLFGRIKPTGKLPVPVGDLYPMEYGG